MIKPAQKFDVTIAGELNLDLLLYGVPAELPPERELLASDMTITLGGSSAIVAHNLAALGNRVGFVSRIGKDSLGDIALQRMAEAGVDVSRVRCSENGTGSGLSVILHHGAWRNILTYLGTISQLSIADVDLDYMASGRHFHSSSLFLQTALRPHMAELVKELKGAGLTISMDTNDDPADTWEGVHELLRYVDVLMPNEREALKISGEQTLDSAMARLAAEVPLVVIKTGPEGAIAQRGKDRFTAGPVKVDAIDAVGAGDSFDAGFISQYIRGADVETCLFHGNIAGALSTTKPGGTEAFRNRDYREQFLREHNGEGKADCREKQLVRSK